MQVKESKEEVEPHVSGCLANAWNALVRLKRLAAACSAKVILSFPCPIWKAAATIG
ncbi:MAG TPA: hypothetical protein VFA77_05935 [Candidatus Eisenbacteria bacterium]|nr:hypothetical protein [Candidatus Eisenbacteria bacterium]